MEEKQNKHRGFLVDALLEIGHLETAMSHLDEIVVENTEHNSLIEAIYTQRVNLMRWVEKENEGKYWCVIKHLATAYVLCEEIFHATKDTEAEMLMTACGDLLAEAAEEEFRLEKTKCLRCLSEKGGK